MTLENLLYKIGETAIKNKIINFSAVGGDIYDLNVQNVKDYPVLFAAPTGGHDVRRNTTEYEVTFYFLDRLLSDSYNDVQIFSTAVEQLKLILRLVENIKGVVDVSDEYEISNFIETERMNDRVAGAFATVKIMVQNVSECYDTEFVTLMLKLENKQINIDKNGHYSVTYNKQYDGLRRVDIDVNVDMSPAYNEGYDNGRNDGYQDGYGVGRAEGVEQGRELAAAEAGDIVTSGDVYTTYSGAPEVDYELTGDNFYSYASISGGGISFNTGIPLTKTTRIEFWYDGTGASYGYYDKMIVGTDWAGVENSFGIYREDETGYAAVIRGNNIRFQLSEGWHRISMSYAEGLYVDGEKIDDFTRNIVSPTTYIVINGTSFDQLYNGSGGKFGMVKVDDSVFVPDYYGFKNRDNDESLNISIKKTSDTYFFYETKAPILYNGLIKSVVVKPKISVGENKLKFAYSGMESIPESLDFKGIMNWSGMFQYAESLTSLNGIPTDAVPISIEYMLRSTKNLTDIEALRGWNTSYLTTMTGWCPATGIKDFSPIENWQTSQVKSFTQMIHNCIEVETIPAIDCSSVNTINGYPIYGTLDSNFTKLVNLGGFPNMKMSWTNNNGLYCCKSLSRESCINVLNGLYDFNAHNETPSSSQGQLKVNPNFIELVGDDIAIGLNKGWQIIS